MPAVDAGPRFGDEVWDFGSLARPAAMGDRRIEFSRLEEGYRLPCKEVLMVLANPTHPRVVGAGVVRRDKPRSIRSLHGDAYVLITIAQWGRKQGLAGPADWKQAHADAFLLAMKEGTHRDDGGPLGPQTIRKYIDALKALREFGPVLTGGGLTFMPWGARTATNVAEVQWNAENSTRPMPWEMWAPLVAASWRIVDQFSDDIITARDRFESLPSRDGGPTGKQGAKAIEAWLAEGNPIPLHTGHGLDGSARGVVNWSLIFRLVPCRSTLTKRTHHAYQPETIRRVAELARDPERAVYGGLATPKATIQHDDGGRSPWIDELGIGEVVYFVSILRAACYILLAALTGMRNGEIQELRRGCVTEVDGLHGITSIQRKGKPHPDGQQRVWWAPTPVLRVIEVLERLSPSPTQLFGRSAADRSPYQYLRDVARLVEFVNADPSERIGRGRGLGLEPIDMSSKTPINQATLRRSFSVYAVMHPAAELGLGIQLGHAALRMTSGYARDSQEQAVKMFDDERTRAARQQVQALLNAEVSSAGAPALELHQFQGQVVGDPARVERLIDSVAERYHVGAFNDCVFTAHRAACGPDGPHLASQHCATARCSNALYLNRHLPTVIAQITRIDEWIDSGTGHPQVIEQLRDDRERLAAIVRDLQREGMVDDVQQEGQ